MAVVIRKGGVEGGGGGGRGGWGVGWSESRVERSKTKSLKGTE